MFNVLLMFKTEGRAVFGLSKQEIDMIQNKWKKHISTTLEKSAWVLDSGVIDRIYPDSIK